MNPLGDKGFWRCRSGKINVDKGLSHIARAPGEATVNRLVVGSNPTRGAKLFKYLDEYSVKGAKVAAVMGNVRELR